MKTRRRFLLAEICNGCHSVTLLMLQVVNGPFNIQRLNLRKLKLLGDQSLGEPKLGKTIQPAWHFSTPNKKYQLTILKLNIEIQNIKRLEALLPNLNELKMC